MKIQKDIRKNVFATSTQEMNISQQYEGQLDESDLVEIKQDMQQVVDDIFEEADIQIAKARGEATANEIVSKSITPTLLQWEMVKKWNGVSPQVTNGGVIPTFSVK